MAEAGTATIREVRRSRSFVYAVVIGSNRAVPSIDYAMLDRTEFARWRESAEEARRSADLQASSRLFNWACFIAEQGAQLAIKGLLHGIGAGAWGHDLVHLGTTLAEATEEPAPDELDAALRRLSRHYIPARYPDAHPGGSPGMHYGSEDAEQALLDLGAVLAHVDALWNALSASAEGA